MAIQRATDEANIRQRINRWVEALRAMDLDGVMSQYAPDLVSFDIVPPLRHVGAKARERNWAHLFLIVNQLFVDRHRSLILLHRWSFTQFYLYPLPLKGWHTLRHSYTTLLRQNGNDPKVVQDLLRHASYSITANVL